MRLKRINEITPKIRQYIDNEMYMFNFDVGSYFILKNNNLIGMIDYSIFNDYIEIHSIQISERYRNKGYGREVLMHLLNKKPTVCGEATNLSVGFYQRIDNAKINIDKDIITFYITKD